MGEVVTLMRVFNQGGQKLTGSQLRSNLKISQLSRITTLANNARWGNDFDAAEFISIVRERMESQPDLARQYIELPINVQHCWEGYPLVDSAIQSLEQGWFLDSATLTDAVYMDDRIAACLETRSNAIFSLPMEFKYQGEDDKSDAQRAEDPRITAAKQLVVRVVKKNWEQMVPDAALKETFFWGLMLNAGPSELVWNWSQPDATGKSLFIPTLKAWHPQFLYWRWDTRSYWLIHLGGQVELHPGDGRWVLYSPKGHNHGWLKGMIRSLGMLWLDRRYTMRDWARAEEKLSLGIIKGYVPSQTNDVDKAKFEAFLSDLPQEATITLPFTEKHEDGYDIEMMKTEQIGNGFESFIRRTEKLERDIAILILGQNLTTEVGGSGKSSSGGGSRAAAQVHDSVRKEYLKADARSLATMFKSQIVGPFVRTNFATLAAQLSMQVEDLVPNVTFTVEPPQDKQLGSKSVSDIFAGIANLLKATAPPAPSAPSFDKEGKALPALPPPEPGPDVPVDFRALLQKYDIPVTETQSDHEEEAPPGDVNERPRNPSLEPVMDPDIQRPPEKMSDDAWREKMRRIVENARREVKLSQEEGGPWLRFETEGLGGEPCDMCGDLHGSEYPADDPFWDENMPPIHPNCRCSIEPTEPPEE